MKYYILYLLLIIVVVASSLAYTMYAIEWMLWSLLFSSCVSLAVWLVHTIKESRELSNTLNSQRASLNELKKQH